MKTNMNVNKKIYDIIGKKYGYLTVKECKSYDGNINKARFICECTCGNSKELGYSALLKNKNISCGCKNNVHGAKTYIKPQNMVGKQYGKLIVIEELEPHITPNGSKQRIVKVKAWYTQLFGI